VGDERSVGEGVAGVDVVAGVHQEVLALGDVVVGLLAGVGDHADGDLALALVVVELDAPGDLGHDRGVLGRAGLEDLGDPGQAADDVGRAGHFLGLAGEHLAHRDPLALGDLDAGPWRAGG
jgi:hypothetical protein